MAVATETRLDIVKLAPRIGAEVRGVDLSCELDDETFGQIRDAWHAHAVLVFRDRGRAGHDYLVTGQGELSRNTQWWFEVTGATVHFDRQLSEANLHHALRVGIVAVFGIATLHIIEGNGAVVAILALTTGFAAETVLLGTVLLRPRRSMS